MRRTCEASPVEVACPRNQAGWRPGRKWVLWAGRGSHPSSFERIPPMEPLSGSKGFVFFLGFCFFCFVLFFKGKPSRLGASWTHLGWNRRRWARASTTAGLGTPTSPADSLLQRVRIVASCGDSLGSTYQSISCWRDRQVMCCSEAQLIALSVWCSEGRSGGNDASDRICRGEILGGFRG